MDLVLMIFLISWISHLENAQTFQMLTYFINYLKIIWISITNNINRKLSSKYLWYWEAAKFTGTDTSFQNLSFFFESLKFYHW